MVKIVISIVALVLFTGCDSISNSNSNAVTVTSSPQPAPSPTPHPTPQPTPEPEPEVPDVGIGSLKYKPTCSNGFATVTYVYQDDTNIDPNSFVIIHSVDGVRQDLVVGNVLSNGTISRMEEDIYIEENESDYQVAHQIEITFIAGGISQLQSFSFMQPGCEEEDKEELSMVIDLDL